MVIRKSAFACCSSVADFKTLQKIIAVPLIKKGISKIKSKNVVLIRRVRKENVKDGEKKHLSIPI